MFPSECAIEMTHGMRVRVEGTREPDGVPRPSAWRGRAGARERGSEGARERVIDYLAEM